MSKIKGKPRFTPLNINATTLNELADELEAVKSELQALRASISTAATQAVKQKEKEAPKQES